MSAARCWTSTAAAPSAAEAKRRARTATAALYGRFTAQPRIRHGALTGNGSISGPYTDRRFSMFIDILFLLGGLALFGIAGVAVAAAERL